MTPIEIMGSFGEINFGNFPTEDLNRMRDEFLAYVNSDVEIPQEYLRNFLDRMFNENAVWSSVSKFALSAIQGIILRIDFEDFGNLIFFFEVLSSRDKSNRHLKLNFITRVLSESEILAKELTFLSTIEIEKMMSNLGYYFCYIIHNPFFRSDEKAFVEFFNKIKNMMPVRDHNKEKMVPIYGFILYEVNFRSKTINSKNGIYITYLISLFDRDLACMTNHGYTHISPIVLSRVIRSLINHKEDNGGRSIVSNEFMERILEHRKIQEKFIQDGGEVRL